MPTGNIVVYGSDIVGNVSVGTTSGTGNENEGIAVVQNGVRLFEDDDIVVVTVNNLDSNGEIAPGANAGASDMTVYDSYADYVAGIVKYNYNPQNPGQVMNVQEDLSGLGDSYVRFGNGSLKPVDGGPSFNDFMIIPGENAAATLTSGGNITLNRNTDIDFNNDGDFNDPLEDGNNFFFAGDYASTPVCFTAGTLIRTPRGPVAIETLRSGDLVETLDNGSLPLRWVGQTRVPALGPLAPILIKRGFLGNTRDLLVSPNHRMLRQDNHAELLFAEPEVLIAAKFLVDGRNVVIKSGGMVTYFHIQFDTHQLVWAEDCLSESLYPDFTATDPSFVAGRTEITTLFPGLAKVAPNGKAPQARRSLNRYEAAVLQD